MEAHIWEFEIGGEVEKYMTNDGISPKSLVTPEGDRVEIGDVADRKGVSIEELISRPVGQYDVSDVDLQFYSEFEGAGLQAFLEINKGHITILCPECKRSQVNKSSFVQIADNYGISLLGTLLTGESTPTVAEMVKDYLIDPERIGEIFNLERMGDTWACKNCGATILTD